MDMDEIILKFTLKGNETRITIMILGKKKKIGRISLSDFKTIIVTVIRTVWYWQRDRQIDKWNSSENPYIDSQKSAQMIFGKGAKAIH